MNEHGPWQQNVRRLLAGALMSTLACCVASAANGQEETAEEAAGAAAGRSQQEQSLKQQLEATERLRRELEAELVRLRAQVDSLKGDSAGRAAAGQPSGLQGGARGGLRGLRNAPRGGSPAVAERTHLKIFRLRHRDAMQMRELVLLFTPQESGAELNTGGAPGSGQAVGAQQAGGIGARGVVAAGRSDLRVVADARSGSIIVRATEDVLGEVEKLVKTFDVPPGTVPVLEDQSQGVFTVRHADPEHVVGLLRDLGVDAMLAPNTNTLSVQGSETTLKEVGDLLEALDVEGDE